MDGKMTWAGRGEYEDQTDELTNGDDQEMPARLAHLGLTTKTLESSFLFDNKTTCFLYSS